MQIKHILFHKKGFALNLVLKVKGFFYIFVMFT